MRVKARLTVMLLAAAVSCSSALAQTKRPPAKTTTPPAAQKTATAPISISKSCPIPRNELEQVYRLYMKDGSFQPVTECELLDAGQRVHYKSAERGEWED